MSAATRTQHATSTAVVAVGLIVFSACGGDGPSTPAETAAQIELIGQAVLTTEVGTEIDGPRVLVRGSRGTAMPGVLVTCFVATGTSELSVPTVTTAADGTATCGRWTFPEQPEVTIARATLVGIDTVQVAANVRVGPPVQLVLSQAPSTDVFSGVTLDIQPVLVTNDRFGNRSPLANLEVTAQTDVPGIVVYGGTVTTGVDGRAAFTRLGFSGPAGPFTLRFEANGFDDVSAGAKTLQPSPPGATTPARIAFRIPAPKILVLDPGQNVLAPPVDAFNASEIPLPSAITQLKTRAPSLVGTTGDTTLNALSPGRSFVVAQSVVDTIVSDSLLAYITRAAGAPLVKTDLAQFSLFAGNDIEVRVLVDMRASGLLSGATIDVAYPRSSPSLMTLLTVTPSAGTTATASTTAGLVRLAYANATGAGGTVEIARLMFRITFSTPSVSQIVLTPLDIVTSTLQNLTSTTTALNPPFLVRQ
ncbi:MAG TPA: hypothetical protein VJR92_11890 [Gemmatimonadaceae bacterium]|nr:hypothetical protein [Gemmatimonadaceae bacterium]